MSPCANSERSLRSLALCCISRRRRWRERWNGNRGRRSSQRESRWKDAASVSGRAAVRGTRGNRRQSCQNPRGNGLGAHQQGLAGRYGLHRKGGPIRRTAFHNQERAGSHSVERLIGPTVPDVSSVATSVVHSRCMHMARDPASLKERAREYRRRAQSASDQGTVKRLLQLAEDFEDEARALEQQQRDS
jgi:hypothetical protein